MQRTLFLACLAVLAAAPAAAQGGAATPPAQAQAPARIAFVNVQEILRRTPGYVAAESTFLREFQGMRDEVQKLQQQLDSAGQAFEQQSIALSPAARQAKQRELAGMQQRMEQRTTELNERANARQQELLAPIQARIKSVIDGIRAEMNYTAIFDVDSPGTNVFSFDPALNISARVLQRLQQAQ